MDEEFDEPLKRAVFSKLGRVAPFITEVTIGPGSQRKPKPSAKATHPSPSKQTSKENAKQRSPRTEQSLPTRQLLEMLDLERKEQVQKALSSRLSVFTQFEKSQQEESKEARLRVQQKLLSDMEKEDMRIIEAIQRYDSGQSAAVAHMAYIRQNALHQMKQRQDKLEADKLKLAKDVGAQEIYTNIISFYETIKKVIQMANSCDINGRKWSEIVELEHDELEKLNAKVRKLQSKRNMELSVTDLKEDIQSSEEIAARVREICTNYAARVEKYVADKVTEQKKHLETQTDGKQHLNTTETVLYVQPQTIESQPAVIPEQAVQDINNKYINAKDLDTYEAIMKFKIEFEKSISPLECDPDLKTFRIECKKAINIPVNSLSAINSDNLLDKYQRLHGLLAGHTVMVGNRQINASSHPQGKAFCMGFLARKFVLQGDIIVSSRPEAAFCYATVILSLWNDFPEFGRLLLGYFYQSCPYLVPYYVPRQVGDSDEDFYKKLGYQYNEGVIESQDKFLKRMTGIMRLYFALTISQPKRNQTSPWDLKHSWKWLSSFLKLDPQVDITATALHIFLETVGFQMKATYGMVFERLINIIVKVFLPKCHQANCTGGALTRLELLIEEYMQTHKLEQPEGYMENSTW